MLWVGGPYYADWGYTIWGSLGAQNLKKGQSEAPLNYTAAHAHI